MAFLLEVLSAFKVLLLALFSTFMDFLPMDFLQTVLSTLIGAACGVFAAFFYKSTEIERKK